MGLAPGCKVSFGPNSAFWAARFGQRVLDSAHYVGPHASRYCPLFVFWGLRIARVA